MKCKICGAKLKKEDGDICTSCYQKYQEEEDLKQDTTVIYKFNRSFNIGYEIMRYMILYFIFLLTILMLISTKEWLEVLLCIAGFVIIMGALFYKDKVMANGTSVTCYETKMV